MMKFLGLPELASVHGAHVDKLILYVHLLMGALFIGWFAYFAYAVFRFSGTRNRKASYVGVTGHASSWVEVAVALVEAVLLIGFAVPLWAKFADDFPKENATVMRVTAEQFAWNTRYPGADGVFGKQDVKLVSSQNPMGIDPDDAAGKDDIVASLNEMAVPLGKPVVAHITSKDVIHSFKVPAFRLTQDANPGLSIPVWFEPTKTGRYIVKCAQLCGNSHAFMKAYLDVMEPAQYTEWLAKKSASGAAAAGGFE